MSALCQKQTFRFCRLRGARIGNGPKQGFGIGDSADPLQCFWVSHSTGDASQRVELCAISCFGKQEQEDDINQPIVYGFKIDTFAQPCEEAEGRFEAPQSRVRKRHAVANAGRSKLLAFGDLSCDLVRG